MTELYVYYRVDIRYGAAARAEILGLQAALRARWPGLETRLLQRTDTVDHAAPDPGGRSSDGSRPSDPTWMEIYRHPDGIETVLASLLAAAADLPSDRRGPRHVERFRPLD